MTNRKQILLEAIKDSVSAVKSTMGVAGRTVLIRDKYGFGFTTTKDGVTVVKSINYEDELKQCGADFVRNAAIKTVDEAGDGTTTTSVLLEAYCDEVNKEVLSGKAPRDIVNVLENDLNLIRDYLKTHSKKVSDTNIIRDVALVSSNNDEVISGIIKDIYDDVKTFDVVIDVEESDDVNTSYDIISGFTLENTGYVSTVFVNNPDKGRVEFINSKIYLYNGKIKSMTQDLMSIFEANVDRNDPNFRPLVLIVDDIEEAPLREIILALQMEKIFSVAIVQSSLIYKDRKDAFIDASVFLSADYKEDRLGNPGGCEKVVITKNDITFINGAGDVSKHVERIEKIDDNSVSHTNRLFRLRSKAAKIYVGGKLSSEINERKDRVDDAVLAVKSAIEEGYSLGAGKTYLNAVFNLDNLSSISKKALQSCYKQLLINAGLDPYEYISELRSASFEDGFNLLNNKIENLFEAGIIDSTKSLRVSMENAIKSAQNFAMIEYVIL